MSNEKLKQVGQLEFFSGWKDIANYMGKGVRTVQRYERQLGLPIRRPAGKSHGSVIATKTEINAWVIATPLSDTFNVPFRPADNREKLKSLRQQISELHRLSEESTRWRHGLIASREALTLSLELLHKSLGLAVAGTPQSPKSLRGVCYGARTNV